MPKLIYFCFTSKNKHFPWRTEDCLCLRACVMCKCMCASVCAGVVVYLVVFVELQQRRSVSRWRWLDDFWLLGRQLPLLAHAIATSNRQTENLTRSLPLPHTLSTCLTFPLFPSFLLCHIQIVIVTRVCPCRQLTTLGITVNSWLDNCNATDAAAIVRGLFSDRCDLHKLCEGGAIMRYIFQRRGQIAVNRQSDWLTSVCLTV